MKVGILSVLIAAPLLAGNETDERTKRIEEAATVLSEIMNAKDNSIPQDLLEKARCVGIVPNLKRAGFVVGGKYGKGIVTCRLPESNRWSAPATVRIEGGSIGFQIGAGETDVVFIVMNQSGEDKLMKDKFTIGADASAMAGPVGRSAQARPTRGCGPRSSAIRVLAERLQEPRWKARHCGLTTKTTVNFTAAK